jgi:Putative metal-binding motif
MRRLLGRAWIAAAVALGCVSGGPASPATAQANDPLPLLELVGPSGTGRLYTLSRSEAATAVSDYGMQLQPPRVGYLRARPFADSVELYRLDANDGPWLVTASASERDSLVSSGRFVYQGVLGYSHRSSQPGTARLMRYSIDGEWRVAFESDGPALVSAGYRVDGSLGYAEVSPSAPPPPQADRDGDGFAPPADCMDNDATVWPGAPEIPGNGIDDDCAGGDAPVRITATVKSGWRVTRAGARVVRLRVIDAPVDARVTVRCLPGKRCRFKRRSTVVGDDGAANLRRLVRRRLMPVGTTLEVRIVAPGAIGKVVRYRIRRGQIPDGRRLCLPPAARTPERC